MNEYTAVVISYDDGLTLYRLIKEILVSDVSRVVVMYGGHNGESESLRKIQDTRLILEENEERLGKCECLNRALTHVTGDFVFVMSGDIEIDHGVFERVLSSFSDDVGVVVPKVQPRKERGIHGILGAMIWKLHDIQLSYLSARGMNVHGGEFIGIRRSLLKTLPLVVNDDAYLCLSARSSGYYVAYNEGAIVHNFLPLNTYDLIRQRIRINFGHRQLLNMKMDPLVMSTMVLTNRKIFFDILRIYLKKYPRDAFVLPLVFFIELLSITVAQIHIISGKSYLIWPLIKRNTH